METYIRKTKSASRVIPSPAKTICQPPFAQVLQQYARHVFAFPSASTFPPIQRMVPLGEIARDRFVQKLNSFLPDGRMTSNVYHNTLQDHWGEIGISGALWGRINLIPYGRFTGAEYLERVLLSIERFYNRPRVHIGGDLAADGHAFNPALGAPEAPGTVLKGLSDALLQILFPPDGAADEHYIFTDALAPAAIHPTTSLHQPTPEDITPDQLTDKEARGLRLFNSIVTKQLPDVSIRRDATGLTTAAWYSENRVHLKSHSSRQDLIHELGHHLEDHLGTDEFVLLHRFLRARSRVKPQQEKEGMTRVGYPFKDSRGYSAYMPNLHLSHRPSLFQAIKGSNSKTYKYASLVYDQGNSTEYLSTTVELFTHPAEVRKLVRHDPLRAALLLKIANPNVYALVSGLIPNMDALIHA